MSYEKDYVNFTALYDTEIPQGAGSVKIVRPRQENKGPDKTSTGKDLTLFNPLHQPYTNKS